MSAPELNSIRQGALGGFLAAGASLVAGAGVMLFLRPGIPFVGLDLPGRMKYLADHQRGWTAGWLLAGLAALALVNLYGVLAWRWRTRSSQLCRLALILSAAGLAADLSGMAIWGLVAPGLEGAAFEVVEKTAVALIFFLSKILYTLSGVFLTIAGAREWPGWLVGLSAPVWISGALLGAATLGQRALAQTWALYSLVAFFILWSLLVGRWFLRQVLPPPDPAGSRFVPDPRD